MVKTNRIAFFDASALMRQTRILLANITGDKDSSEQHERKAIVKQQQLQKCGYYFFFFFGVNRKYIKN